MEWNYAPDIDHRIKDLVETLNLDYVNPRRIFCFRSNGSSSRARARIWSFPKIWQMALGCPPAYCIEVVSERFDKLSDNEQKRTLIHELMHIPKNFSGALLPHLKRNMSQVDKLFKQLFMP